MVEKRYEKRNVAEQGFSSFEQFMEWISLGPVQLELNRDVFMGEEIICTYEWTSLSEVMKEAKNVECEDDEKAEEELITDSEIPEDEALVNEGTAAVSEPKYDNMPRSQVMQPCGECGINVTGECTCDVCGSWMHSFHGICFGEEEESSTRRCKKHELSREVIPHEEKKGEPQSDSVARLSTKKTRGEKFQAQPRTSPRKKKTAPVPPPTTQPSRKKLDSITESQSPPKKKSRKAVPESAVGHHDRSKMQRVNMAQRIQRLDEALSSSP